MKRRGEKGREGKKRKDMGKGRGGWVDVKGREGVDRCCGRKGRKGVDG